MPDPNKTLLDDLVEFVSHHKRLFILTGAGCSTQSGIPDYRDGDGQWKRKQPVQYQDFVRSKNARQRYWARSMLGWPIMAQARPNPTHYALAQLESAGLIYQLVTQNVDGLHQKAGSQRVIDLHGRLDTVECLSCHTRLSRETFQQALQTGNPDLQGMTADKAPDGDADLENIDFHEFQIPACATCGGVLKPSVVFFGESVPRWRVDRAYAHLEDADALLIIGSSLMVFSGYRFCRTARQQNKPIAAINLGRTRADHELTLKMAGRCEELLPGLMDRLNL
jgi:NAD-dependent SIR2 family protein deacetylase